jgi:rhamnulose-1-phosphate aldolase
MIKAFEENQEIKKIAEDIQKVAGMLWERGWSEKNAGNISVKLPDSLKDISILSAPEQKFDTSLPLIGRKCFYITGTGKRMQDVSQSAAENGVLIQVNDSGDGYYLIKSGSKELKPSSEFVSHMAIHHLIAERGGEETVVIHTHATEIIAITHYPSIKKTEDLNRVLWGMHPEAIEFIPKGVGLVPYNLSGTQQMANLTIEKIKNHDIVVWEKHGILAIGKSLIETFDSIDIANKLAKIWFICKSAGFEPQGMTEEQIKEKKNNS